MGPYFHEPLKMSVFLMEALIFMCWKVAHLVLKYNENIPFCFCLEGPLPHSSQVNCGPPCSFALYLSPSPPVFNAQPTHIPAHCSQRKVTTAEFPHTPSSKSIYFLCTPTCSKELTVLSNLFLHALDCILSCLFKDFISSVMPPLSYLLNVLISSSSVSSSLLE